MYRIIIQLPTDENIGFLWVKKSKGGLKITNRPELAKIFNSKRIMEKFIKCYLSDLPYSIIESEKIWDNYEKI